MTEIATGCTVNIDVDMQIDISDLTDHIIFFRNLETGNVDLEKEAEASTTHLTCRKESTELESLGTYRVYGRSTDGTDITKCVEGDILEVVPEGGR